ncbi:MAG: SDR family oxidoreductase, partial [Clostridia bacterium]
HVVINYRTSAAAANALKSMCGDAEIICADVSERAQVEDMFARIGHVDVLVNNAGISCEKLFTEVSADEWNAMLGVTLTGAFNCIQCALPNMISKKRGKIINVSSIWGMVGASCEVAYSAAKAGIIGLTRALAKEVGPSGITVNCVAPGVIETDMLKGLSECTKKELAEDTPLGVLGKPSDIAESILFLASSRADFITGQVLSPNGGFVI